MYIKIDYSRPVPQQLTNLDNVTEEIDIDGQALGSKLSTQDIILTFNALDSTINSLNLKNNDLSNLSVSDLVSVLSAIPSTVKFINLKRNNLSKYSGPELALILASLTNATSINLCANKLDLLSGSDLALVFQAIPNSVTSLNLEDNHLYNKSIDDLILALAAIPPSITTLSLNGNKLGILSGTDLARIFAAIPSSVNTLILQHNNFDDMLHDDFCFTLANIPISITVLDIGSNNLASKPIDELVQALRAIPASVLDLSLEDNRIWRLAFQDIVSIFAAIPHVTKLSIGDFEFKEEPLSKLVSVLQAIPTTITGIRLDYSVLGNFTLAFMTELFAAIPSHVIYLSLKYNYFGDPKSSDAILALGTLHVKELDLTHNFLGQLSSDKLIQAFSAISTELQFLSLGLNEFDRLPESALIQIVGSFPKDLLNIKFDKSSRIIKVFYHLRPAAQLKEAMEFYPGSPPYKHLDTQKAFQLFSAIPPSANAEFCEAQFWLSKIICYHSNLTPENFDQELKDDKKARLFAMKPYVDAAADRGNELALIEKLRLDAELDMLNENDRTNYSSFSFFSIPVSPVNTEKSTASICLKI